MEITRTIEDFLRIRTNICGTVGAVFTMGALHAGHLELVRQAKSDNEVVIATIFVNPTQFGRGEDFSRYPRDEDEDIKLLQDSNVDVVFIPQEVEIYPADFGTTVDIGELSERLEGFSRPGHFKGVCTVVLKLLNIVNPDTAYFGQKDAQQLIIIRKMVKDLNVRTTIESVPTLREPDGLAMSSRNLYLNHEERRMAGVVPKSLSLAVECYRNGVRYAPNIVALIRECLDSEPLLVIDYISVADMTTLEELAVIGDSALVSLAVNIGTTRLIDNVVLGHSLPGTV